MAIIEGFVLLILCFYVTLNFRVIFFFLCNRAFRNYLKPEMKVNFPRQNLHLVLTVPGLTTTWRT